MHKYSVIIPVRKINDFIRENISHLKKQNYDNFEVIIITDDYEDYDFGDPRFKLVVSGNKGPGEKRNIGASKAGGDILVFLDDDAYPTANWLYEADKIFENPQIYALGGPAVTPPNATFLENISGRIIESKIASGDVTYRHIPSKKRLIDDYPTVNLFVRKKAFEDVGGFYIEFWPGEDTKLCLDLVKRFGRPFNYDPNPVVFHHRRNVFKPHLKQISRYGMHRGQFARIFPQTSRLRFYLVPSIFVMFLPIGLIISFFNEILRNLYILVLFVYLALILNEALKVYTKDKSVKAMIYFCIGVFLTHIIYGINFIIGFYNKPKLKLKNIDTKTGNYSEG